MKRFIAVLAAVLTVAVLGPGMIQAQVEAQQVVNSEIPGSVLIFHKFIRGSVVVGNGPAPALTPILAPATEIEVGVATPVPDTFAFGTRINIRGHWVCPGSKNTTNPALLLCKETDFFVTVTTHGKIFFSPEGFDFGPGIANTNQFSRGAGNVGNAVPQPDCEEGFLILWVVDTFGRPINFNYLVGEAILREGNQSAGAYNAIPVQAVGGPDNAPVLTGASGELIFNGLPGFYALLPNTVVGDVRYDRRNTNATPAGLGAITTFLTLLTIDVRSNVEANFPVSVPLFFFREDESQVSTSHEFVCWDQVPLTPGFPVGINSNLTEQGMFSRKGLLVSGVAQKFPIFGVADTAGPVTLLGIVSTKERRLGPTSAILREYSYNLFHRANSYTATSFFPFQ